MEAIAHINPLNMQVHVDGYGDMTEDVARELAAMRIERIEHEAAVVARRQAYLKREHGESTMMANGALVGQVDEAVFQHYIDRYGAKWWSDKGNRRWFFKRHPECTVKAVPQKPVIRMAQLPSYRMTDRRSSAHLIN